VLRADLDWSQADLADRLFVSRQAVNAIETGRSDPSLSLAFRIAKLFGSLIEEIFVPEGQAPPTRSVRRDRGDSGKLRACRPQDDRERAIGAPAPHLTDISLAVILRTPSLRQCGSEVLERASRSVSR
jgi:putative transcriptional regulator